MGIFDWFFGSPADKMGGMPKAPQMGEFKPYHSTQNLQAPDMTWYDQAMGEYMKGAKKDIGEYAAGTGLKGRGTYTPQLENLYSQIAGQRAQTMFGMQQEQARMIDEQYLAHIGQQYGLQSAQYQGEMQKYLLKYQDALQQDSPFESLMGMAGKGVGMYMGHQFPFGGMTGMMKEYMGGGG